jgi:hypothetical protein
LLNLRYTIMLIYWRFIMENRSPEELKLDTKYRKMHLIDLMLYFGAWSLTIIAAYAFFASFFWDLDVKIFGAMKNFYWITVFAYAIIRRKMRRQYPEVCSNRRSEWLMGVWLGVGVICGAATTFVYHDKADLMTELVWLYGFLAAILFGSNAVEKFFSDLLNGK